MTLSLSADCLTTPASNNKTKHSIIKAFIFSRPNICVNCWTFRYYIFYSLQLKYSVCLAQTENLQNCVRKFVCPFFTLHFFKSEAWIMNGIIVDAAKTFNRNSDNETKRRQNKLSNANIFWD